MHGKAQAIDRVVEAPIPTAVLTVSTDLRLAKSKAVISDMAFNALLYSPMCSITAIKMDAHSMYAAE